MNEPPLHHNAPPDLRAWLDGKQAAAIRSVKEVTVDGVPCVVKRRRPGVRRGISYVLRYLRAFFLALLCRILLGEFPRPSVLLRNGLDYEAERLRRLLQAGCRVPEVWWQEPGLLVLEHVGDDLPFRLRQADEAGRIALAQALARDLAEFHGRGMWHGGAQVRNVTLRDGRLWRIDFEENIGGALSLPLAQAYDLYQTLASLVSLRKLPPEQASHLGKLVLDTYFAAHPDSEVRARMRRIARLICGAARLLRPLGGRLPWRDVRAFFRVAETLRLLLHP